MARSAQSDFDAVIFDCDGVLVDSELFISEALATVFASLDLDYDIADHCRRHLGRESSVTFSELDRECRERFDRALPEDFRKQCFATFRAAAQGRLAEVPGASAALERIGLPKAVASSSSRDGLTWKLDLVGLGRFFGGHTYGREDVVRAKPAPDIYLHAASQLGAEPSRCLVIEDSETGLEAARSAGMTVWRFTGGSHFSQVSGAPADGLADWGAVLDRLS